MKEDKRVEKELKFRKKQRQMRKDGIIKPPEWVSDHRHRWRKRIGRRERRHEKNT